MSIVLIVSKTQMRNSVCVGGIREDNCELIRIFDAQGYNLSPNVPYEIGDRWEMCVENVRHMRMEPHVEDKRTRAIRRIENVGVEGIARFINEHTQALGNRIVKGNLEQAFEGCLHLQGTRNFVNFELGYGPVVGSFMGSLVVSLIAVKAVHWFHVPNHVLTIPSVIPMIPGVLMYRALFALINMNGVVGEVTTVVSNGINASLIILSIAFGVAVPNIFARRYIAKDRQRFLKEELQKRRERGKFIEW